jgi:hypothetical protein
MPGMSASSVPYREATKHLKRRGDEIRTLDPGSLIPAGGAN